MTKKSIVNKKNSSLKKDSKQSLMNEDFKKENLNKKKNQDIIPMLFRKRKFSDSYLVMNDYGNWLFLKNKEYNLLKNEEFDDANLLIKLKENNFVITKENQEKDISRLVKKCRDKKEFLFYGPSLHIIITTLRCDLKCSYCHASSKPFNSKGYDMDKDTAKKAVDLIFQTPSNSITIEFQGGEPLLNFEIIKFITEYAKEKNKTIKKDLRMTLVTNMTNMDMNKLNYLIKNEVAICTSLDGPEKLHNFNRGGYSSVKKWSDTINSEFKKRNIKYSKLNALLTVTKESLKNPKEIIDEYIQFGFNGIHIRSLNSLGHARNKSDKINYSAEEFIEFWKKSMDYIIQLNQSGTFFMERKAIIILKKIFDDFDPNYTDLRSPCGAVTGQLVYNYDGQVYSCDEGRMIENDLFNLGTVDDNFKTITTNPTACSIIAASINDTQHCDVCVYKPLCGLCPALNYATSGSVICHIPSSDWCKIHKAQFDYIFDKLVNDQSAKQIFMKWIKEGHLITL